MVSGLPNSTPTFSLNWLINITIVFVLLIDPDNFLNAWLINLACNPTCESPISPSISACGTRAATESITIIETASLLTRASHISKACSPVSGCDNNSSSVFTPKLWAYTGSSECSASINAALPPCFCTSAIACNANVVLPEDSGPYISIILPLGYPPTPRAISKLNEPLGHTSTSLCSCSPSFIIAPFPNCFSMSANTCSNAESFSTVFAIIPLFPTLSLITKQLYNIFFWLSIHFSTFVRVFCVFLEIILINI